MKTKTCPECKRPFSYENNAQVYCGRACRSAAQKKRKISRPGHWATEDVTCSCGTVFQRGEASSPNRKYCSTECAALAIERSTKAFAKRNPGAMRKYNQARYKKYGRDGLVERVRKKYPDLPTVCEVEGCSEDRVTDFAHKPEFKRNGRHRSLKEYERHKFWVLCPTHHALIDRGVCSPDDLGLS